MKLRPATIYKINQVINITIVWLIANLLIELYNAVNYDPRSGSFFFYFMFGKNAFEHLLITSIGPLAGGLLGGSFIIFYQREKLKGKTYGQKLLVHSLFYLLFVIFCTLLVGLIAATRESGPGSFEDRFMRAFYNLRVLRLLVTWYFVVILTIFFLDVSEKYGKGVLKKLLFGKYHKPLQEDRVFLFLDLKSSTTIAEKLGDTAYFRMLKEFFYCTTEPILNCRGEIYQYVGDEIIISWEKAEGLKNANCLSCFTLIGETIQQHSKLFLQQFGVVPEFKAAIHAGVVTTGEIGVIKKEIVYSGDILNTTARIMALCNQYNSRLIVSGIIYTALKETRGYRFDFLGTTALRGKSEDISLYSVIPQKG